MALDARENQPDELFWAHEATAPLCIGGGRGFGSDNFVERPALLFEGRDLVPHTNQQIAVEGELGLIANGTMPWDDNHLVRDFGKVSLGSADCAVYAPAG